MKVRFAGGMAILLFLAIVWIIGCGDQIDRPTNSEEFSLSPVSAAPAGYWHILTDGERNQLIIDKARTQIGCVYKGNGQCKGWVQTTVWNVSWNTVWLPANYTCCPSDPYYLAKWDPETPTDVKAVLRGTSNICCYWACFKPGQIVQMRHDYQGGTPHTMILETLSSSGFTVIDCNWDPKSSPNKVSEHWISSSWFRDHCKAWTVYQVK
jgi:hypothetical protein